MYGECYLPHRKKEIGKQKEPNMFGASITVTSLALLNVFI